MSARATIRGLAWAIITVLLVTPPAGASDACSNRAIVTTADVAVSDGSSFRTESYFHTVDNAAIRHLYDAPQTIAVEGPSGWVRAAGQSEIGSEFHKLFALSHQFHALLLDFDEIVSNPRHSESIELAGETVSARTGDFPYGGTVHLIQGPDEARPLGLVQHAPGNMTIETTFFDWRESGTVWVPYHVRIDDGERVFDYRYHEVDLSDRSPLWYFEAVDAPLLDAVELYRLHRKLLAAHCLGDANMIADLSAPNVLLASRGQLLESAREAVRSQFRSLFERIDYTAYNDILTPNIEIAEAGDLAWYGVNVRLTATVIETGRAFDQQWAWIMLARKIDGEWRHAGNSSNSLPSN